VIRPSHEDIAELLGAYALDAVDADERALVEDHLRGCPRCREEVRQHRDVAAHLAFSGETAPAGIWERITADLGTGPADPDLARLYPFPPAAAPRPWLGRGLGAAAAVILLVVGALSWEVHTQADRVTAVKRQVAGSGLQGAALAALVDPGATKFVLTSTTGTVRIDGVIEPDGHGYLVPAAHGGLPALPASETYQLWGVDGARQVSLGLLGARPGIVAFQAAGPPVGEVAVTAERSGGAVQPTHPPVAAAVVTS
jgi:hypothetical protein